MPTVLLSSFTNTETNSDAKTIDANYGKEERNKSNLLHKDPNTARIAYDWSGPPCIRLDNSEGKVQLHLSQKPSIHSHLHI